MKNKLSKWFLIWGLVMVLGITLFAFFGPQGKKINLEEIDFKTTQSSELYFKNIRAYFYEISEDSSSGFKICRMEAYQSVDSILSFTILSNWRMGEAYLMTESPLLDSSAARALDLIIGRSGKDTISLIGLDAEAHFAFAARLFSTLSREEEVKILDKGKCIELKEQQKKVIRKNLSDYFKLVGKLH